MDYRTLMIDFITKLDNKLLSDFDEIYGTIFYENTTDYNLYFDRINSIILSSSLEDLYLLAKAYSRNFTNLSGEKYNIVPYAVSRYLETKLNNETKDINKLQDIIKLQAETILKLMN